MKTLLLILFLLSVVSCGKKDSENKSDSSNSSTIEEITQSDLDEVNIRLTVNKKICDYHLTYSTSLLRTFSSMELELSLLILNHEVRKSNGLILQTELYEYLLKLKKYQFIDPEILTQEELSKMLDAIYNVNGKKNEDLKTAYCIFTLESEFNKGLLETLSTALETNKRAIKEYNANIGNAQRWLHFKLKLGALDENLSIIRIRNSKNLAPSEYEAFKKNLQKIISLGTSYGILFDEQVRESFLMLEKAVEEDLKSFETELIPAGAPFYIIGLKNIEKNLEAVIEELDRYDGR